MNRVVDRGQYCVFEMHVAHGGSLSIDLRGTVGLTSIVSSRSALFAALLDESRARDVGA
jgi:hypothetical protein